MKKKVILLAVALMLVATGVVSAAANWGKFEGYNIVKLVINGKEVTPKDTPPVILKGRTMVPLNLLEQAGLSATWNKDTYTVDVVTEESEIEELQRVAITMDIYSALKDFYDTFNSYEVALTQSITYKDYRPYLNALSNYIETFADFRDMEEYILNVEEYTQETEYGATSYNDILKDYNTALESISESIDLLGVYFDSGSETNLLKVNKLIEKLRVYNNSALDKTKSSHTILQDIVYGK